MANTSPKIVMVFAVILNLTNPTSHYETIKKATLEDFKKIK